MHARYPLLVVIFLLALFAPATARAADPNPPGPTWTGDGEWFTCADPRLGRLFTRTTDPDHWLEQIDPVDGSTTWSLSEANVPEGEVAYLPSSDQVLVRGDNVLTAVDGTTGAVAWHVSHLDWFVAWHANESAGELSLATCPREQNGQIWISDNGTSSDWQVYSSFTGSHTNNPVGSLPPATSIIRYPDIPGYGFVHTNFGPDFQASYNNGFALRGTTMWAIRNDGALLATNTDNADLLYATPPLFPLKYSTLQPWAFAAAYENSVVTLIGETTVAFGNRASCGRVDISTSQDTPISGQVTCITANPTFSIGEQPSHGSASVTTTGEVTYTPSAGYTGQDAFTVVPSDSRGSSIPVEIGVRIDAPPVVYEMCGSPVVTGYPGETVRVNFPCHIADSDTDVIPADNSLDVIRVDIDTWDVPIPANAIVGPTSRAFWIGDSADLALGLYGQSFWVDILVKKRPTDASSTAAKDACTNFWGFQNLVPNLLLTDSTGRCIGRPSRDKIVGTSGIDQLYGRGGNDIVWSKGGADEVFGGNGQDLLLGERGADQIHGGDGGDTIVGGPGRDVLLGDRGNDLIKARDGQRDMIRCGRGSGDVAIVDMLDVVHRSCEAVRRK